MNLFRYLKDNKSIILYTIAILVIINIILYSSHTIDTDYEDIIYMDILILGITIVYLGIDYLNWKNRYNDIYNNLLTDKNIDRLVKNGKIEEDIINMIVDLKNIDKKKETDLLKIELKEINDYITKWIHEIKIPISVLELLSDKVENLEEFELSNEIRLEVERLNFLVNQVLYTSRSIDFSKDLYIEKIDLNKIINEFNKKNMNILIDKKIELDIKELDRDIYSDRKWVSYTVDQIINNSCKYIEDNGKIDIYFEEIEDGLILNIKDNGIGIPKKDISRIFDKGFTGENGRRKGHSTGMGLYLSSKMGEKINYRLYVESELGEYTVIKIVFNNINRYFNVLESR